MAASRRTGREVDDGLGQLDSEGDRPLCLAGPEAGERPA
jgi:hypothetical protein